MERRGHMCSYRLPDPNAGELDMCIITQTSVEPFVVTDISATLAFNPRQELASPENSLVYFSTALAPYFEPDSEFRNVISQNAAMLAFVNAHNGGWQYGVLIRLVVQNVHPREDHVLPPLPPPADSEEEDDDDYENHNDNEDDDDDVSDNTNPTSQPNDVSYDTNPSSYANLDNNLVGDAVMSNDVIESFALLQVDSNENGEGDGGDREESTSGGLLEQEISMLKKEQVESDNIEESCCVVCLEEFTAGALITPLSPCSHKFHNLCIVKWLRKNRTCPICRSICTVD